MKNEEIETAYCEDCDEEVLYTVGKEKRHLLIGKNKIPVDVETYVCYCKKCGRPLLPSKYWSLNDIIIYDEYKKKLGLLTSKEIIRIRKKRHMSQTDLANFIHCGEKNIARYERGAIQDPVFDYLIRLVENDEVYEQMKNINNEMTRNNLILSPKNS